MDEKKPYWEVIVALVGFRAKREREREERHKLLLHKFCNNLMDGKKSPIEKWVLHQWES